MTEIMKLVFFLPFLVAAFAADSVYWSQRVNNGFVREPMNNFTASLYEPYLASLEGLDKCGSYTLKESLVRRDEAIITLECDGKIKFAQGTMDQVKRREDLESDPPLDDPEFTDASAHQDKLFPWFETIKSEGCSVDYLSCTVKMLPGFVFEFTCPEKCDDDTTHRYFDFDASNGENSLTELLDTPNLPGSEKTCIAHMQGLLETADDNTKIILNNKGLKASNLADLSVLTGHFLEMTAGTQYCLQVQDANGVEASISIFKFQKDGTIPVIVAEPFADLDACLLFLKKVSCQWASQCTYGF